jgi:hypothetical protein
MHDLLLWNEMPAERVKAATGALDAADGVTAVPDDLNEGAFYFISDPHWRNCEPEPSSDSLWRVHPRLSVASEKGLLDYNPGEPPDVTIPSTECNDRSSTVFSANRFKILQSQHLSADHFYPLARHNSVTQPMAEVKSACLADRHTPHKPHPTRNRLQNVPSRRFIQRDTT